MYLHVIQYFYDFPLAHRLFCRVDVCVEGCLNPSFIIEIIILLLSELLEENLLLLNVGVTYF